MKFEKELQKLEQQLRGTSKSDLAGQKRLKDQITQVKGALKGQSVALKDLNNQRKKAGELERRKIEDLRDNGGAIAVLDSLTGGLATRIRDTAEASKLLNFSLKGTRTALIATGIGAFVVALGLVVAYWEDIKNFISGSNVELERKLDSTQKLGDAQQRELDILDKQDNVLKLQGKTQKEINALKKEELNDVIAIREEELILAKERLQQLQDIKKAGGSSLESFARGATNLLSAIGTAVDKLFGKLGFDTNFGSAATGITDSVLETIFGTDADIEEAEARVKELEDVLLDSQNRLAGIILSEKPEEDTQKRGQVSTVSELTPSQLTELTLDNQFQEAKTKIFNDGSEARKLIAKEEAQFQRDVLYKSAEVLGQFGQLLQQLGEKNKALAVAGIIAEQIASTAKIIISTVEANAKAVAISPATFGQPFVALNTISAGLGIASGVASASKAISALGGGGSAGGGGLSLPSGGQSAPSFNVVGNSGVSQIGQTLNQEQEPVQAFVVGNAVTSQQALDRDIVDTATLG